MAKRPDDRYQTASEMLVDLESVLTAIERHGSAKRAIVTGSGRLRRRFQFVAVLIAALAVIVASTYHLYRDAESPLTAIEGGAHVAAAPIAAPAGRPIKVGVLHSLSGTMAESESVVVEATLLAIDELNAAGGLLGRPIEAIVRDGQSEPAIFEKEAKKLLNDEHVCTVFGCWTSASRKTVAPTFEHHNNLLVYPVQYEGLEESPNVIYLGATPNQQIVPALRWAFAFGGKRRFFVVGSDYIFPRAASAIIHDVLEGLGGQIVGEEYLALGSYEVKPIVEKIVETSPDVILNLINGDSNVPFFKSLRTAGVSPDRVPTISFSIGEEELRHLNIAEMVGDYAAWSYFQSIDTPDNHAFVNRFQAKYGPQRVMTDPMEAAYSGVKLWAQAVKQAGSDDVLSIRRAMLHQHILAPEGELQIESRTHHVTQTPRIGQITPSGQFDIIWEAVKPKAPVPFPPSRMRAQWNDLLQDWYALLGQSLVGAGSIGRRPIGLGPSRQVEHHDLGRLERDKVKFRPLADGRRVAFAQRDLAQTH